MQWILDQHAPVSCETRPNGDRLTLSIMLSIMLSITLSTMLGTVLLHALAYTLSHLITPVTVCTVGSIAVIPLT